MCLVSKITVSGLNLTDAIFESRFKFQYKLTKTHAINKYKIIKPRETTIWHTITIQA